MPELSTVGAIERQINLRADPARVWRALTDPEELAAWFGQAADFRAEAGATGWFEWDGYGRFQCVVEAVEPGRYLAWRGASEPNAPVDRSASTLVEWWVEPRPNGGTTLRLRESGLSDERSADENTYGWLEEVSDLQDHLATEDWQRPLRRKLELRADLTSVWSALTNPAEYDRWAGARGEVEIRPGAEGWFVTDDYGRRAVRIVAVEEHRYFAWLWAPAEEGVPLTDAREILLVEWVLQRRDDGGTDRYLKESGHIGPDTRTSNETGWDEIGKMFR